MASISVRNLDNNLYEQLRLRATRHGRSMEEEVRQIISQAVSAPEQVSTVFQRYFGRQNGVVLRIPKRRPHEPLDFNE